MSWKEQEMKTRQEMQTSRERSDLLDKVKSESLPIVRKEVEAGSRSIAPVKFQPVQSPKLFEAEFGVKDGDLIFHFWPWGHHLAERSDAPRPSFMKEFGATLKKVMNEEFDGKRLKIAEDRDMNAWFVNAKGYGKVQFHHKLGVSAVTALHFALGGKPS